MSIDVNELRALPNDEKLRIVELLWDELGNSNAPIELPDWIAQEVTRRRNDMRDPSFGLSHDETWRRIANRNG
jgi:putative addiction module component (TIGR02574 family)